MSMSTTSGLCVGIFSNASSAEQHSATHWMSLMLSRICKSCLRNLGSSSTTATVFFIMTSCCLLSRLQHQAHHHIGSRIRTAFDSASSANIRQPTFHVGQSITHPVV